MLPPGLWLWGAGLKPCGGGGRYRWENPLSHVLRVLGDILGIQLAFH